MIPTNIRVNETFKSSLGTFYASLFDKVLAKHPDIVDPGEMYVHARMNRAARARPVVHGKT
jgi:hypothetical protein